MIMLTRFLLIIFILVTSFSNIFSQTEVTTAKTSTAKTVAIYSSKKSFFQDYPIDTLVLHLNSLNTNSGITYYKSTEDRSKTGFYADYLIDIDLWMKEPFLEVPKWEIIRRTEPKMVSVRQRGGTYQQVLQYITIKEEVLVNPGLKPGEGEIQIKIIEKSKNEKVTRKTLFAKNNNKQDLKFVLIISLIEFLLGHVV
jgi:hypothetical protein